MENGSSLFSRTHTNNIRRYSAHTQIDRHTIWCCAINVRERDESLHVYRFGKHVRCASCKILLIYDYLLHILVARGALVHNWQRNIVAVKLSDTMYDGGGKKAISVTENLNANATTHVQRTSAIHFVRCAGATVVAAATALAHRYLCQLLCRISGCTIIGNARHRRNYSRQAFLGCAWCMLYGISRHISVHRRQRQPYLVRLIKLLMNWII